VEIEPAGADGRWRIRRFEHVDGKLASLRLFESGGARHPRGRANSWPWRSVTRSTHHRPGGPHHHRGDSLDADVAGCTCPLCAERTRSRALPRDTALYSLDVRADSADARDVRSSTRAPRGDRAARTRGGALATAAACSKCGSTRELRDGAAR